MVGRVDLVKEERTAVRGIKRLASIVSEICFAPGIEGKGGGKKGDKAGAKRYVLVQKRQQDTPSRRWRKQVWRYDRCTVRAWMEFGLEILVADEMLSLVQASSSAIPHRYARVPHTGLLSGGSPFWGGGRTGGQARLRVVGLGA